MENTVNIDKILQTLGLTLEEICMLTGEELFLHITGAWLKKNITHEEHEYLLTQWEAKNNQPIELNNINTLL